MQGDDEKSYTHRALKAEENRQLASEVRAWLSNPARSLVSPGEQRGRQRVEGAQGAPLPLQAPSRTIVLVPAAMTPESERARRLSQTTVEQEPRLGASMLTRALFARKVRLHRRSALLRSSRRALSIAHFCAKVDWKIVPWQHKAHYAFHACATLLH